MATYAAYRHIELDKVGYSKKRVRNPPSDIINVISTPTSNGKSPSNGRSVVDGTPRRRSSDSFNRLFGDSPSQIQTPRRASLTKHDVKNRNPVTGNGVQTWDNKVANRSPKIHTERNPVTGEVYQIISPAVTPTKAMTNDFPKINGNAELPSGPVTNGQA